MTQRTSNQENSLPTRDEGTTFDCETCRDTGEVDITLGGYSTSDPHAKCPDCRSEERMKEQFTSNERTQQLRYPDAWGDTALLKRNAKWAADELDRQRAEVEQLRTLLRIARDEWYDDNGQWGDGFGLKHWTRKADALLSDESSFRETEQHRE